MCSSSCKHICLQRQTRLSCLWNAWNMRVHYNVHLIGTVHVSIGLLCSVFLLLQTCCMCHLVDNNQDWRVWRWRIISIESCFLFYFLLLFLTSLIIFKGLYKAAYEYSIWLVHVNLAWIYLIMGMDSHAHLRLARICTFLWLWNVNKKWITKVRCYFMDVIAS